MILQVLQVPAVAAVPILCRTSRRIIFVGWGIPQRSSKWSIFVDLCGRFLQGLWQNGGIL
jgi:hypothetical protein